MSMSAMGSFVYGQWREVDEPDGEIVRVNPSRPDEQVYAFPYRVADVDEAVAAARAAAPGWARLGFDERLRAVERFGEVLSRRAPMLAEAISREMGKPLWEARGEVGALTAKIKIMSTQGAALVADRPISGGLTTFRPLGVLAVLGPFNFPLHLPNGHIIPGLLHGNTIVIKPSEHAASSMQLYVDCAREANLPPGVINLVHGAGDVGGALSTHEGVDGVLFTGSYETGLRIKRATLEQHWKLLALEMGGKNTSIVCEDANLEQVAHEVLQAAFLTTGQRCSATSRLAVHARVFDEVVDRLKALTARITTGDPIDEEVFMGPLADLRAYRRFVALQQDDEGGKLRPIVAGGARGDEADGWFVRPAIWEALELDPQGVHQAQELFAPELVLYRFEADAEAVQIANATDFGLAMSVFTGDTARFERLAPELRAGILNLNRSTVGASSALPFGGVKKSGNHRPSALHASLYCTYPQAQLHVPPGWEDASASAGPLAYLKG